ncbi:hotdog fold thioesterase, partial [Vibrio parahaemolyticus]|nr:hotdog fold thioesterase [Vibrio parahaemolyticus]
LADSLGSIAAYFGVSEGKYCVGLDISANHVRAIRSGYVIGTAIPIHHGVSTQGWQVYSTDGRERVVCTSRLPMALGLDQATVGY